MAADHPTVYRSSLDAPFEESVLRSTLLRGEPITQQGVSYVPLRLGMRTVGALGVTGDELLAKLWMPLEVLRAWPLSGSAR